MNRKNPSTIPAQPEACICGTLGLTLQLPRDEPTVPSSTWFEDVRIARALLAGTFWVRGIPTHPQHLPGEVDPPHIAFRALDGLLETAARWRVNVILQIGDENAPANLQAASAICRRLKGRVEGYVFSAGESADAGEVRSLLSLVRLARQADPAAKLGIMAAADALVELHQRQPEELEPVDFVAFRPRITTDHRGWRRRAIDEAIVQVERLAAAGKPVWVGGLSCCGGGVWAPLVSDAKRGFGVADLVNALTSAGVERICFDEPRGEGGLLTSCGLMTHAADVFHGYGTAAMDRPVAISVQPLRLRSALPAEVEVRTAGLRDESERGRLRLEYAGKVGEQSTICFDPKTPEGLALTLTLHPEHLAEGVNVVFARFVPEGRESMEVYAFNQVVRPVRPALSGPKTGAAVTYQPKIAEVGAFLHRFGGDVAIVVGRAGVASQLAGRLADRLERMTGRRVEARLATDAGDVMDRPLILLTVGEDNVLASVAQQDFARGRITARSPAAGKGRIIHVRSPFGETENDPRCGQVGLYYDVVPEALIVGGSDEAGLTAAVEDLLERMPPVSGVQS